MPEIKTISSKFYAFALAAVFALTLAGCGGGGGTTEEPPAPMPPTAEEMCADAGNHWVDGACLTPSENTVRMALAAIAAAATAEDAQAAYNAVKDDVSAAQGDALQAAVDARVTAIATMARETAQKIALSEAAGDIDTSDLSTQAMIDAARGAIASLREALDAADDVSDADKAMYKTQLDDAVDDVDDAQGGIDTKMRRENQMGELMSASGKLQAALAALSGQTPTETLLDKANKARNDLNDELSKAMDLTDAEKAPYQREADNAATPIRMAQDVFDKNENENTKSGNADMMATAMKLYDGISGPVGIAGTPAVNDRIAGYNAGDSAIEVSIGDGTNTPTPVPLSEDKDTTLETRYGWTGVRLTAEPEGDGTYEAHIYSNVGEPTEGAKFSATYPYNAVEVGGANTELTIDTSGADVARRVESPRFDQSAGKKEFKLGSNERRVMIPGSYHGVSGTYYCTPASGETCSSTVAEDGFTLGNGTWTFKATDKDARLMDMPDAIYSSYGWWIHKSEDGKTFTASAFVDDRGAVSAASGITALRGTATYMGGAAGKYALHSMTGGTNDAGHFTARATLEADFNDDTITGTIDNFMGADNKSRDWSVTLSKSTVSDTGAIAGDPDVDTNTDPQMTVWTLDGTPAAA
ncbi:MAG: hypothetical protein F4X83_06785, partial [Chloroflexi bacterium]|nr:hypothetical protein [Chloroflexota bacterium]